MIYPISVSYSQVCGMVRDHPAGSPDRFDTFIDRSIYVDEVYLTCNHISTYTTATTVGSNTRRYDQCNMKPSDMPRTNFTCTTAHCDYVLTLLLVGLQCKWSRNFANSK